MLGTLLFVSCYIHLVALSAAIVNTLTSTATGDEKKIPIDSKKPKKRKHILHGFMSPILSGMNIHITLCRVVGLVIVYLETPGKFKEGWRAPVFQLWKQNPAYLFDYWGVIGWFTRRDYHNLAANLPLPQETGSQYPFKCMLCELDTEETIGEMGIHMEEFFTNNNHDQNSSKFKRPTYKYIDQTPTPLLPLNYYLRNRDCFIILKKLQDQQTSKAQIEEKRDILSQFFGTAEEGLSLLQGMSEDDWEAI